MNSTSVPYIKIPADALAAMLDTPINPESLTLEVTLPTADIVDKPLVDKRGIDIAPVLAAATESLQMLQGMYNISTTANKLRTEIQNLRKPPVILAESKQGIADMLTALQKELDFVTQEFKQLLERFDVTLSEK